MGQGFSRGTYAGTPVRLVMADKKKKSSDKERPNLIRRIGAAIYRKIDRYEQKRRKEMGMTGDERDAYKIKPYIKP